MLLMVGDDGGRTLVMCMKEGGKEDFQFWRYGFEGEFPPSLEISE